MARTSGRERIERFQIARRLEDARVACGLSARQAAERTGINMWKIYAYEKGERCPSDERIGLLAQAYGVSVESLLPQVRNAECGIREEE